MKPSRHWNWLGIALSFMILGDGAPRVSEAGFVASAAVASKPGGDALEGRDSRVGFESEPETVSRPSSIFGSGSTAREPIDPSLAMLAVVAQLGQDLWADFRGTPALNDQEFQTVAIEPRATGSSLDRSRGIWGRLLTHGNPPENPDAGTLDAPPSVVLVGFGLVLLTLLRRR
jgi:hypothetical protein